MPVPKRKRSRARKYKRNANKGVCVKAFTACRNCDEPLATHQACHKCGFYKGVKALRTKEERSARRLVEKTKQAERRKQQQEETEAPAQDAE